MHIGDMYVQLTWPKAVTECLFGISIGMYPPYHRISKNVARQTYNADLY
jgi:hypothetical protein